MFLISGITVSSFTSQPYIFDLSFKEYVLRLYAAESVKIFGNNDDKFGLYVFYRMFGFCTKLEKFVLKENNSYFAVYDGILYNGDFSVMYTVPKAIRGKITLHEGLAKIGNTAFSGCVNLTEVTLPASVTNLGSYVFNDCSALEKVIFTNPAGWSVINPVNNKSTPINEEYLADPVKAKDLLSDYISYKWQRA